jgi:predicted nuclease of predicted toxin-antitoxin system
LKFLVDNQLPPTLASWLTSQGWEAKHVLEVGLDETADRTVWRYAAEHGMVVISKDPDFLYLERQTGVSVPFVWVRLGNCRKQPLLQAFESALPKIVSALEEGHRVVELR